MKHVTTIVKREEEAGALTKKVLPFKKNFLFYYRSNSYAD
jgi:hypothetical protein